MKVSELAEMAEVSTKTVYSHMNRNKFFDITDKYDCANFILYHLWRNSLSPDDKANSFLCDCGCFIYAGLEPSQVEEIKQVYGIGKAEFSYTPLPYLS